MSAESSLFFEPSNFVDAAATDMDAVRQLLDTSRSELPARVRMNSRKNGTGRKTRTGSPSFLRGDYKILVQKDLDVGLEAPLLRRGGSVLPELAELQFQYNAFMLNP